MNVYDLSDCQPLDRVHVLAEDHGADGFIFKLGETLGGTPELDDNFSAYANDAVAEGKPFGIYYVPHARDEDGFKREAEWMNDTLFDLLGGSFPELGIWWDMEVPVVLRDDVCGQLLNIIGYQQTMYEANKWKIGIYASYSNFHRFFNLDDLVYYGIPLWVAQYNSVNDLKKEREDLRHVAWQYTDSYAPEAFGGEQEQDANEWYGF